MLGAETGAIFPGPGTAIGGFAGVMGDLKKNNLSKTF